MTDKTVSVSTESRPTAEQFIDNYYKQRGRVNVRANSFTFEQICEIAEAYAASSSLLPVPRQIQVQCEMCDGTGRMHVTHDMAIDAGNLNLSGQLISCGTCGGDGFQIEQAEPNEYEKLASLPVEESTKVKPCKHCGHANPHDGPAGTVDDICTHPECNCGFYQPELITGKE